MAPVRGSGARLAGELGVWLDRFPAVAVFAGFILLLLGSAFVGLQAMRSIEQGAVHLVEEQRESSSLIDDIQQIEYDLDAIFYSLTTGASPEERRDLLVTLASLERQIETITAAGLQTRDAERWKEVESRMEAFISQVRSALQTEGDVSPALHADILMPYRQKMDNI